MELGGELETPSPAPLSPPNSNSPPTRSSVYRVTSPSPAPQEEREEDSQTEGSSHHTQRPTTPTSTAISEAETTPSRKKTFALKPKKKAGTAGATAPGALGDFVKWGKRKNNSIAPAPRTNIQSTTPGGTAENSVDNSETDSVVSEEDDYDSR